MATDTDADFALFGEEDWARQEAQDDNALAQLLAETQQQGNNDIFDTERPFDQADKADDAEDFEDISDDDLADDDEGVNTQGPGLTDDGGTSHDTDDLFGDGRDSSPFEEHVEEHVEEQDGILIQETGEAQSPEPTGSGLTFPGAEPVSDFRDINFDPEPKPYQFGNQDLSIPAPPESAEELFKQTWPTFKTGVIINWSELLPPKNAHYIPKAPVKTPKPVNPTKVTLDIAPDQERSFRTAGPATFSKNQWIAETESKGLVPIVEESSEEKSEDEDFDWDIPSGEDEIAGVTWTDLEMLVDDWDSKINPVESEPDIEIPDAPNHVGEEDAWDQDFLEPAAKRLKTSQSESDFINAPLFATPSFDDFERATIQVAKRVTLDFNDPHLLLDVHAPNPAKRARLGGNFKRGGSGFSKSLTQRFNISNDEAYDALKENHQSKVRATIGNPTVDHSMPALKLVWPYYRVKLHTKEARSFHRPALKFQKFMNQVITFSKPALRKKKHMRGLKPQEIFKESKDLSLADNSTATLFEYSEEYPTVLSNFGMGNRVINYYRRKDDSDLTRPKLDIGETNVLLPEDKSPFSIFGSVDPGETVPTLHNSMYRAPIFKQDPKNTDFLCIRSSTGIGGTAWHIRNIDNLFIVGQQFPSVEIPGPHSRKFTTAAKNRMKMIAYRQLRHNPHGDLKISSITAHITDSTDMQNRQKLKEFLTYHKDDKVWRMRAGEQVPDEETVRAMVKPEDVCLIDAMQVGVCHLEVAGYGKTEDTGEEGDEGQEGEDLEQQLAPWKTSKNFLEASADKAMLQLYGEGDPSGRGLAFSFIKTSMKGGFLEQRHGPQMTSEDAMARERKANGGHKYNVDKQNAAYREAIQDIWGKQKHTLSDEQEHSDNETHDEDEEMENGIAPTPAGATPSHFDDSASAISRFSTSSRRGRSMRIVRQVKGAYGQIEEVTEIVRDHRVWREYQKRRNALNMAANE
jgi:hypothetical protein